MQKFRLDPLSPNGISIENSNITIAGGSSSTTSGVQSIVAGTNITVDNTDPANPIVSATGELGSDELVKLSATDPTAGYLDAKLQEGIQGIQYDLTPTGITTGEGMSYWNSDDGTLNIGMPGGNVNLQVGQETIIRCKNDTLSTIANGAVVYISGSTGDRPQISLADADSITTSFVLGVATESIAADHFGYVTLTGTVRDVNTNGMTEGLPVWLSQTAGQFTQSIPEAPAISVFIGYVIRAHATEGVIAIRPVVVPRFNSLSDIYGEADTTGQIPVWNETNNYFAFSKNINDYRTYSGFENHTDSTITIDADGLFTLAPAVTSFNVWTNGTGKHVISTPQTVTVTDDQTITYIYVDGNGELKKATLPWDLDSGAVAPCSIVFKDGTSYTITDERHSYARNAQWHTWAHFNIGAMYRSGLTGTFTNTTLSITQGVIADEDIDFDTLDTKTSASLWYRNSTNGMRLIRNSSTPYRAAAGVLQYDDGSGTLQSVGNAKYVNSWVYCSNDAVEPIYIVLGQAQYDTLNLARNATRPTINLSTAEWKLLYRVTFQNNNGTPGFSEAVDFRAVQSGVPTSVPAGTSHTSLIDRDAINSHPATAISNTPAGNIAATTVQAALNELDSEKVAANAAIVAATKTKISYDTKGLVTSGADATTADIADSTNKRYVTDAQLSALHSAVTVTDSTEIDFTITGQDITASIKTGSIDETKLDTSTNASLDLADGSVQKSTYDAHSVLYATTDNTPVALTVGEQTVVGRTTGGNISALTIDSDLSSVSANDDTIPSAKATKTYADTKVPTNGALGTPTSGALTNCTGLPVAGITASTSSALGVGTIELGHATDTTLSRPGAGRLQIEGKEVATLDNSMSFTNKTITDASNTVNASTITVATETADATCYPAFFNSTSGSLAIKTKSTLEYDSTLDTLKTPYIKTNTIDEYISGNGVYVDGLQCKDNLVVGGAGTGVANSSLDTTAGDIGGVWLSWTPSWTNVSGGTLNYAKYTKIGKTIQFRLKYTLGGAGVSGETIFSLPVTANSDYAAVANIEPIGLVTFRDTGTALNNGVVAIVSTTTAVCRVYLASGTYAAPGATSSTVPFTWANTDQIIVSGTYEAA